tara:strand:+ start:152 stop:664 length:513 start_codon:yes stop_codon:yes gene_type:complete
MGEFRNRTSGEVLSQGEVRALNRNMSLPRVWDSNVCDALNVDPVLPSAAATTTAYQYSARDGVEQDANGNWVEKYVAKDMFADTTETDKDGKETTTTKAEHEAAYQASLDAEQATTHRVTRDSKLAETDFYALSDVTMSSEMTTYRQALRDLPTHKNWPYLEDADWPTKP